MKLSTLLGEIITEENFEQKIPEDIVEQFDGIMAMLLNGSGNLPDNVSNFNSQAAILAINSTINMWENWIYQEHNEIIGKFAKQKNIPSIKWQLNKVEFRWLRENITPQLKSVESLLVEFGEALLDYQEYYRNRYGRKGLMDTFFGVFKNPIETTKDVFNNKDDKTMTKVLNIESRLRSSIDHLITQLVSTFQDFFLYKTVPAVNEIASIDSSV